MSERIIHTVSYFGQDYSAPEKVPPGARFFDERWDLPRVLRFSFRSKLDAEAAADIVFRITNAPLDCLRPAEARFAARYRGPSASVGDVVEVDGVRLLCAGCGWKREAVSQVREAAPAERTEVTEDTIGTSHRLRRKRAQGPKI